MMGATTALIGADVDVYWNFHKRVWSVRDHRTRLVVAHLDGLVLSDVTFRVSASGNARVRSERRKNVHAFARGTVVWPAAEDCHRDDAVQVTYNPYKFTTFVIQDTGEPIFEARKAWLNGRSVLVDMVPPPLPICPTCNGATCPFCGGPDADYHSECFPCETCAGRGSVTV